jgi:hypothetical protein
VRAAFTPVVGWVAGALARASGAPDPGCGWRLLAGPHFDNQVATLALDGKRAEIRLDRTVPDEPVETGFVRSFELRLS